jgi:hypothetical protein
MKVVMSDLLSGAALVRVDVYDGTTTHCAGGRAEPAATPLLSRSFPKGAAVRLDIPPGKRTIVMTTFSDAAGRTPTGSACSEADLAGGRTACVSLSLIEIDGGAVTCSTTDDRCPSGQFCNVGFCDVGCKSMMDCAPPTAKCDPTRHQCVECTSTADCSAGLLCSPSGTCAQACTTSTDCSGGRSCCNSLCIDTRSDVANCGNCGIACTGGNTLCCNGTCANPSTSIDHCGGCGKACSTLNATPTCSAGVCGWTCNTDFIHCGSGNTGCETASSVTNCQGCGNVCTSTNATANRCDATGCGYTCATGFLDCIQVGANTDGCETPSTSTMNCGGCGNVCDTKNSTGANCPSGTCLYDPCPSPRADCNQANHNLDGCECPTPMCCNGGTTCQPVHMNGLGDNYVYMCQALGTPGAMAGYNGPMANAAAAAWSAGTDSGPSPRPGCTGNPSCVQRTSATNCAVWCYSKSVAGYVAKSALASCTCPTTSDSPWN